MTPIFYLTYSDNPKKDGLVFPSELQKGTYSTGIWVVDFQNRRKNLELLEFDAVDNGELLTLKMTRVNRSVFQVDTKKYGKFYFRISYIYYRYEKYVGESKLIPSENRLFQVVPMDIPKLEYTSLKKGFFFVGRVDNDIENKRQ